MSVGSQQVGRKPDWLWFEVMEAWTEDERMEEYRVVPAWLGVCTTQCGVSRKLSVGGKSDSMEFASRSCTVGKVIACMWQTWV